MLPGVGFKQFKFKFMIFLTEEGIVEESLGTNLEQKFAIYGTKIREN